MTKKGRQRGTGAKREAVFHSEFREDLEYWVKTDRKIALRVLTIVGCVARPISGDRETGAAEVLGRGGLVASTDEGTPGCVPGETRAG